MKLATKLIAGFMAIALLLVAMFGAIVVLGAETEKANDEADDETEELQRINRLQAGIYNEQSMAVEYLTTKSPVVAAEILGDKEALSAANAAMLTDLVAEFSEEDEYADVLDDLQRDYQELDETFEEAKNLKEAGSLGAAAVITALNDMVEEITLGSGHGDQEGLDYVMSVMSEELYVSFNRGDLADASNISGNIEDLAEITDTVYEEFLEYITILTATDLVGANSSYQEMVADEGEDEALVQNLTASIAARGGNFTSLAGIMADIEDDMVKLDEAAEENITLKLAGKLDVIYWITIMDDTVKEMMEGNEGIENEGFKALTAEVETELNDAKAEVKAANTLLLTVSIAMVIASIALAIIIGLVMSRSISKPVLEMTGAARRIKDGDLDVTVKEVGKDEIAELGKAFNQMILSVRLVAGALDMGSPSEEDKDERAVPDRGLPAGGAKGD